MNETEHKYSLNSLSLDEINIIVSGLGEIQAKRSHFLLNKISNQITAQDNLKEEQDKKNGVTNA